MSRLIDADKLIKDIVNLLQPARPDETEMYKVDDIFWSLEKLIKEQPTVFDVDKVVSKMETEIEENPYQSEYLAGLYKAIDIVRDGGLDES